MRAPVSMCASALADEEEPEGPGDELVKGPVAGMLVEGGVCLPGLDRVRKNVVAEMIHFLKYKLSEYLF